MVKSHSSRRASIYNKGKWSDEEKHLFLVGLQKFGKGKWKQIGTVLTTRSTIQIKSHGQKVCQKLAEGVDVFSFLGDADENRQSQEKKRPRNDKSLTSVPLDVEGDQFLLNSMALGQLSNPRLGLNMITGNEYSAALALMNLRFEIEPSLQSVDLSPSTTPSSTETMDLSPAPLSFSSAVAV